MSHSDFTQHCEQYSSCREYYDSHLLHTDISQHERWLEQHHGCLERARLEHYRFHQLYWDMRDLGEVLRGPRQEQEQHHHGPVHGQYQLPLHRPEPQPQPPPQRHGLDIIYEDKGRVDQTAAHQQYPASVGETGSTGGLEVVPSTGSHQCFWCGIITQVRSSATRHWKSRCRREAMAVGWSGGDYDWEKPEWFLEVEREGESS